MKSRKHLSVVGLYIWYSLQLSQIQTDCLDEERFLLLCKSGDLNAHIQDEKKNLRNLSLADSGEHSIRISARRFTTANPILCRVRSRKAAVTHYYLPRRRQQDALAGGHCSAVGKEKRLCPEPEVCRERGSRERHSQSVLELVVPSYHAGLRAAAGGEQVQNRPWGLLLKLTAGLWCSLAQAGADVGFPRWLGKLTEEWLTENRLKKYIQGKKK